MTGPLPARLFVACVLASAATASVASTRVPRSLIVRVEGLPPALGQADAWRAWPVGAPAEVAPVAPGETSSPAWRELVVSGELGMTQQWIVVAEAGDQVALSRIAAGSMVAAPAVLPVPPVRATAVAGGVELAWDVPAASGIDGWDLQRSWDGRMFTTVARLAPAAASAFDAAPPGAWTWRLRPVLPDGVASEAAGASSPVAWSSAAADRDGDGILDAVDRCVAVADAAQVDTDGDGVSDACEFAWGDVAPAGAPDGRIDVSDAVIMLRWAVGIGSPTSDQMRRADVAPAVVVGTSPELVTPRQDAPASVAVDDAVLALRAGVGLVRLTPPR